MIINVVNDLINSFLSVGSSAVPPYNSKGAGGSVYLLAESTAPDSKNPAPNPTSDRLIV